MNEDLKEFAPSERDEYKRRIDKAIEYIEKKTYNPSRTINDDRLEINPKDLLDILKGSDSNE